MKYFFLPQKLAIVTICRDQY